MVSLSITLVLNDNASHVIFLPEVMVTRNATAPDNFALLAQHIEHVLGVRVEPTPNVSVLNDLPAFLTGIYEFTPFRLLERHCLAAVPHDPTSLSPAAIRKHFDVVAGRSDALCIYVAVDCGATMRARLIEQRVPFIIPGNQLYVPQLAMDLREHFIRRDTARPEQLGPAAQATLLYVLLHPVLARTTLQDLATRLPYTPMTMTRVANELEAAGIADVERIGRNRWLSFDADKKSLWNRALPMLTSPVSHTDWVFLPKVGPDMSKLRLAGETALAARTNLGAPSTTCRATSAEGWRDLKKYGVAAVPYAEMANTALQVWRYDPAVLSVDDAVDPLSLYLSLRDRQGDDRIELALDDLMETLPWW